MNYHVPTASIVCIVIAFAAGIIVPLALFLYLKKKKNASLRPFLIGWIAFVIAVSVLERLFHMLVLGSPIGSYLTNNLFFYALYGGVTAGLFEELTRYFCFSKLLKEYDEEKDALMYGAGHGGSEMFNLLSVTMANNLAYALTINSSGADAIFSGLTGATLESVQGVISQLCTVPSWMFLLSIVERISALAIQLALSLLVFYAVRYPEKDRKLLCLAVELHALVDFLSVIISGFLPLAASEAVIAFMAVLVVLFAKKICDSHQGEPA